MVKGVLSLTRSGLRDWLIQRITAVIIAAYAIFLLDYFIVNLPHLYYPQWHALFQNPMMQVFTALALLSVVFHAWVGMWTIFTDYIKPTWLRGLLEMLLIIALFAFLIWGFAIIWGIRGMT